MKQFLTIIGFSLLSLISGIILGSSIDNDFEFIQNRLEQSLYICSNLNSMPVSLDLHSVTCEDGRTIEFLEVNL